MADIKISELTQVSALNNGDLVEVSQVNALAPSGYTSLKASMTDLGEKVNTDIEYTTDLADFANKTTLGAIKETAKGKNIADEYDDTQTYNKGDVVIYKNTLYICNTNNTTGTWDATKWTATTVQSLIGDLSQLTTSDKSSLVGAVNEVNGKAVNLADTIDISSSFTKGQSVTGTFYCKAFYNKGTKRVSVSIAVDVTSGSVSTGQAFAYVASAYRPSSNIYGIPMLVKSSSGWQAYNGVLTSGGDLNQNATNTSTGLYASFEYYL